VESTVDFVSCRSGKAAKRAGLMEHVVKTNKWPPLQKEEGGETLPSFAHD
jgi:hypothetical protein